MTAVMAERRVWEVMITRPKTHRPETSLEQVRSWFDDDHVHMALIVAADGRLVTTIERDDLNPTASNSACATMLGTLTGRTGKPGDPLDGATTTLLRTGRRRLAVVDDVGRLLGLLCLKRDGTGYCSDASDRERLQMAATSRADLSSSTRV
jgi:CBS-domain-containing membrane protein